MQHFIRIIIRLFLFLVSIYFQEVLGQYTLIISDTDSNLIANSYVRSKKSNLLFKSDDSGKVKITGINHSDTLVISHYLYKTVYFLFELKEKQYVVLEDDTFSFNGFILKSSKCNEIGKKKSVKNIYMNPIDESVQGFFYMQDYNTKWAQEFIFKNGCGRIKQIEIYIPYINKKTSKRYNLNFYVVDSDTSINKLGIKLIYKTLELHKFKQGWNKIDLDTGYRYITSKILIGFSIEIKDSIGFVKLKKETNGNDPFDYPISLLSTKSAVGVGYYYINYDTNTLPEWYCIKSSYVMNIITEEYE